MDVGSPQTPRRCLTPLNFSCYGLRSFALRKRVFDRKLRLPGDVLVESVGTRREGGMEIEERANGEVMILDLKGKLTIGEGDELLKDKVNSLIQQGHQKLLLNLEGVPYVDSAGLGEIVRTYTTVSRQGGKLKLLNLTKRIEDLLAITKLLTVFETFESEQEAVKSFQT